MNLSLPPEQLATVLDVANKTAYTILQSYAHDHELPTNWRVIVSFRLGNDDLFHVQRTGCDLAVIFVNGYEFLSMDKTDKTRVAKFRVAAVKAIKLAVDLSKTGSALITGDLAYAISKERKRIRREILSIGYNALDDRYFQLSGTLTLTDRLGGRTLSIDIHPFFSLESQLAGLKHNLSLLMLQDSETEELVDILESARIQRRDSIENPEHPTSYTISSVPDGIATHVEYREEFHLPSDIHTSESNSIESEN